MSWLQNLRQQSPEKKTRIIWISSGVAVIILIILWIITARFQKNVTRDTNFLHTLGQGFHDLKNNYNKPIQ